MTASGERAPAGGELLRRGMGDAAPGVAAAGFAALWKGEPVRPGDLLPGRGGLAAEVVDALVQQGRAEVDERGRLVAVHGLTLRATRHRFVHGGRARHTWCAFDAVGIPAALHLDAAVRTDCPTCLATVAVELVGGIPRGAPAVLWLPARGDGNLMAEFCASADLYCSLDHLRERIGARTPGVVADLAAAAALGTETWADVAGTPLGRAGR